MSGDEKIKFVYEQLLGKNGLIVKTEKQEMEINLLKENTSKISDSLDTLIKINTEQVAIRESRKDVKTNRAVMIGMGFTGMATLIAVIKLFYEIQAL